MSKTAGHTAPGKFRIVWSGANYGYSVSIPNYDGGEVYPAETVEALRDALRGLLECSRCKNGCAPDDMTCASRKAERALALAEEQK